jgi:hypothetical protein
MNKYTVFYYYTIYGQRLTDTAHMFATDVEEAIKKATLQYDEILFIAEGHLVDLRLS